jgi:6-phosphogluconolactonase
VSEPRVVVSDTPAAMAAAAARAIAAGIREAVQARGSCSVCLAGGGTPRPIYELLRAEADLPWGEVDIYYGDERCVPPDDPDSNHRMASESLLEGLPARVHRMEAESTDRQAAADRYAADLPQNLDVLILGMGGDGHTASLFPGQDATEEREQKVVVVEGPKPPPWRLTITAPVIEAARQTVVLVTGAGKAGMVARVLRGPLSVRDLPIQLARGGTWYLDQAAAAEL